MKTIGLNAIMAELAAAGIYAWRVRDQRLLTSIGASAEFRDVAIFLAGAGATQFTGEVVKRLTALLDGIARRLRGTDEITDAHAFELAILMRRGAGDVASLSQMRRDGSGNRVFAFDDGSEIELDRHGAAVRVEFAAK